MKRLAVVLMSLALSLLTAGAVMAGGFFFFAKIPMRKPAVIARASGRSSDQPRAHGA